MKTARQSRLPARDRLLVAAGDLFYSRGINATGVDAIVDRAGVAVATLYKQFGSKDHLVAAYLDARDHRWRADWEAAIAAGADPNQRVLAIFEALERWWAAEGSYRGCAQVAATVEITDPEHPATAAVARHKRYLRARLIELTRDTDVAEPEEAAAGILVIYEGTIIALLLDLATDPLARGRQLAVDQLTTSS